MKVLIVFANVLFLGIFAWFAWILLYPIANKFGVFERKIK